MTGEQQRFIIVAVGAFETLTLRPVRKTRSKDLLQFALSTMDTHTYSTTQFVPRKIAGIRFTLAVQSRYKTLQMVHMCTINQRGF